MDFDKILAFLLLVQKGRVRGECSASDVLGISTNTFWRWVAEAERRGVRFAKNRRGYQPDGPQPWRIMAKGEFRRMLG